MRNRVARRREGGQGLVEFAIVIPMFLLIVFSMFDLGRVVWANDSLANAAREGARFASVTGGQTLGGQSSLVTPSTKTDIVNKTNAFNFAGVANVTITVCYSTISASCSGNTDAAGATPVRGNFVTVTIQGIVPMVTGSLIGRGDYTVLGSSTELISN